MSVTTIAELAYGTEVLNDLSAEAGGENMPVGQRFRDLVNTLAVAEYSGEDREFDSLGIYTIDYPQDNDLAIVTETPITEIRFSVTRVMDTEVSGAKEGPEASLDFEALAAQGLIQFVAETDTMTQQLGIEFRGPNGETVLMVDRLPSRTYSFITENQMTVGLPEKIMARKLTAMLNELAHLADQLHPVPREEYPFDGVDEGENEIGPKFPEGYAEAAAMQ